jgi:type III restriction enzyme
VIVATHDPNVVVNGDADLVVRLEADASRGRVAVSGAIEDPAVRTAIIETVDGGRVAFELRKAKYGF